MVADLDDERDRLVAVAVEAVGAFQPARQLDVGAGVHDGVGDEFADDERGVVGEAVGEVLGAGQAEPGPLGERRAHKGACGARRE